MANETQLTIVGNVVAEPETRQVNGATVTNFRVASTPRTYNREANAWEDGEAVFMSCSVWRQQAENFAQSITKGNRVIVQGNLKQSNYQDKDGNNRTAYEIDVIEVGPSLLFNVAHPVKSGGGAPQTQGGFGGQQGGFGGQQAPGQHQGGFGQQAPQGGYAAQGQQLQNDVWGGAPQQGQDFGQPHF